VRPELLCGLKQGVQLTLVEVWRRSCTDLSLRAGGLHQLWYQILEQIIFFLQQREKRNFTAMPPRRRERPIPDPTVEREMRELSARHDAMEMEQR
jgi:hypothetical protein